MPALGERFRAAREARGLTVSDVAEHIRIRSVYLAAIEDENWSAVGAAVYIRGFIRTYARYLNLDPEEMVSEFNRSSGAAPSVASIASEPSRAAAASAPIEPVVSSGRRGFSPLLWIFAVIAVALVAFVVYNEVSLHSGPAQVAQATPSPTPADLGSPTPSPTPSVAPHTLVISLSAPSWLRVTVDGSVSMEGTFPAGTSKSFHGSKVLLNIGNAGGVHVSVNGVDAGKLGGTGDVVERAFPL